jgi:hypothetical protein
MMALDHLSIRVINDPRHGWLEIPKFLSKHICPELAGGTSYTTAQCDYYEEDDEATQFMEAATGIGLKVTFDHIDVDDMDEWINGPNYPMRPEE